MSDSENLIDYWETKWKNRDRKVNKRGKGSFKAQSRQSIAVFRGQSKWEKERLRKELERTLFDGKF